MKTLLCAFLTIGIISVMGHLSPSHAQSSADMNKHGVDLGKKDKLKDAIKEFDRAIKLRDRGSAIVYHNKGYAYERMGKTKEAIKNYKEAWKRNDRQVPTGESLGYLYFKGKDYTNAIRVGERVMVIDPKNKKVPPWLALAYQRLKEQEKVAAAAHKKKKEKKPVKKRGSEIFYITLDAMARFGYYNGPQKKFGGLYSKKPKTVRFISDKGLFLATPFRLFLKFRPIPIIEVNATVENPYLGSLSPDFITQEENVQAMIRLGPIKFGLGALFTHYEDSGKMSFWIKRKVSDYRLGIVFGYETKTSGMMCAIYPRYILREQSKRTGVGFDAVNIDIRYTYKASKIATIYTVIHAREYFLFWHTWGWSNYRGTYDVGFGLTFHDLGIENSSFLKVSISAELIERIYMRKYFESSPYTYYPNGQGWFGLDKSRWNAKNPFSGFWTVTQVLGFRFQQDFGNYFFAYQKLVIEIAGKSQGHQEINMRAGFGFRI